MIEGVGYRRMEFDKLEKEKKLVIYLSRLTFSDEIVAEARGILEDKNMNWFEFYKFTMYHKVMSLCWRNINILFPNIFQPKYISDIVNGVYLTIMERNKLYQTEIERVRCALNANGITVIPVKGAYLIPAMYKDYGIRYSGDADFLIKYDDLIGAEKIVKELGYIKGTYCPKNGTINPISRAEEIKWKSFMSNDHPLLKHSDTKLFPVYKLDFRYALDDNLSKKPIEEILNTYVSNGKKTKVAHYLIHLCTHFYDEAKHSVDILLAKDLNIIKLCDIREYVIQFSSCEDLDELVCFAKKYGVERQVYYTMFFLDILYADGYEKRVMAKLGIENDFFLYTFGENTHKDDQVISIGIFERLFACGNMVGLVKTSGVFDA